MSAMALLRRWTFVNAVAATAFVIALAFRNVPAKLAAEPDLLGLLAVPTIVAAGVWLGLASVRYWALTRA